MSTQSIGLPTAIGFIGIGTMGLPMAKSLLRTCSRSRIFVYDVSETAIQSFISYAGDRGVACASSRDVANKSNFILSMVPAGHHARLVYLDPENGILGANVHDKTMVDCSTIDVATFESIRSEVQRSKPTARFFDAPVSGGSLGAEAGSLTFMVGCSDQDPAWEMLKTLLGCMGTSVFACGGPSLGLTAKLCNNYCSGLIAIATSEAMDIGIKSGMDPRVLANIFATSTAQSRICDKWNPVPGLCPEAPASHNYEGGFKIELMKKDFGLACDAAHQVGSKLCLGKVGLQTYTQASEDPACAGRDSRVIFRYIGGDEKWKERYT